MRLELADGTTERAALLAALMAGWERFSSLSNHPDVAVAENARRQAQAIDRMATRWFGTDWTE